MKKKRVYISGPISGLARSEYLRSFRERERELEAKGYRVTNPCRLPMCRWPWLYRLTLALDLVALSRCDHISMLPGWASSKGANVERYFAMKTNIDEMEVLSDGDVICRHIENQ